MFTLFYSQAYYLFRSCLEISKQDIQWSSEISKNTFLSALHLCNGGINLVLSHLPDKVITLLTIVGYSGDRELAYTLLDKCVMLDTGCYYLIGKIARCLYETLIVNLIGARKIDLNKISHYADKELDIDDKVC